MWEFLHQGLLGTGDAWMLFTVSLWTFSPLCWLAFCANPFLSSPSQFLHFSFTSLVQCDPLIQHFYPTSSYLPGIVPLLDSTSFLHPVLSISIPALWCIDRPYLYNAWRHINKAGTQLHLPLIGIWCLNCLDFWKSFKAPVFSSCLNTLDNRA